MNSDTPREHGPAGFVPQEDSHAVVSESAARPRRGDGELVEGAVRDAGRWQIPMFIAGLLALLVTIWWQPWRMWGRQANWPALAERALAAEENADYSQARQLAEAILSGDAPERWRAVAALVMAGVLFADLDNAWFGDTDWVEALASPEIRLTPRPVPEEMLAQIGTALQQADTQALPRDWQVRWAYRKLWWQILRNEAPSDWPQRLEQLLQENPPERPRGYERLVRWHLWRLASSSYSSEAEREADWEAALQASARLLVQPNVPNESAARIRHALLLLHRHRPAEARELLARISPRDPYYAEALYVLGRAWLVEERYEEATPVWNRLVQVVPANWPRLPQALYWLGVCYAHLQSGEDAERTWQQLLEQYPNAAAERQAAMLRLALLRHDRATENEVLAWLRQGLSAPLEGNPYLQRQQVEAWLRTIWRYWIEHQRLEPARELAELWRNSADNHSVTGKRWLAITLSQIAEPYWQRQSNGEELSTQDQARMQAAYRQAGELFEEIAQASRNGPAEDDPAEPGPTGLRSLTYQAAVCFMRAQDFPRAIRLLEQGLAELDKSASGPTAQTDALRQEMLVVLGECWYQLKLPQKALEAFQRALLLPGPQRIRGYYQMALALMDLGKLDEAERALREVLTVPVSAQEPPEYRKALSALGHLHFRREQYETAAEYLDKAIARYPPDSPSAYSLRYWLAECYHLAGKQEDRKAVAADTETRRQFHRQQKRKHLQRAAEIFDALAQSLLAREKQQPLSADLALLLRESRFALSDCYFHLGEYEKSAAVCETLGREYDRQLAGLRAWFEARRSYLAAGRREDALRAIEQAKRVLEYLTDEDLAPTRMTRQQWLQFLDEARQNALIPDQTR